MNRSGPLALERWRRPSRPGARQECHVWCNFIFFGMLNRCFSVFLDVFSIFACCEVFLKVFLVC